MYVTITWILRVFVNKNKKTPFYFGRPQVIPSNPFRSSTNYTCWEANVLPPRVTIRIFFSQTHSLESLEILGGREGKSQPRGVTRNTGRNKGKYRLSPSCSWFEMGQIPQKLLPYDVENSGALKSSSISIGKYIIPGDPANRSQGLTGFFQNLHPSDAQFAMHLRCTLC